MKQVPSSRRNRQEELGDGPPRSAGYDGDQAVEEPRRSISQLAETASASSSFYLASPDGEFGHELRGVPRLAIERTPEHSFAVKPPTTPAVSGIPHAKFNHAAHRAADLQFPATLAKRRRRLPMPMARTLLDESRRIA